MLQAGKRLRKSTGVMAGTGDRRKSSTLPILLPASRCRRMCCVIAGVSLARRPAAAAFGAFGGWCFVDGEVALELKLGQSRLAEFDARNVKNQVLTPNTRCLRGLPLRSLGAGRLSLPGPHDKNSSLADVRF